MNILHKAAASLAALTLLAGAPALAFAATDMPTSAISVEGVNFEPSSLYDGGAQPLVTVAFKNTSNVTATQVTFDLVADGKVLDTFTDDGTFAPGVTIRHTFYSLADLDGFGSSDVQVESATFAAN